MILEEETYEKFGYYPSDLEPKSHKKILAECDDCGKVREIYHFSRYHTHCKKCAQKGKKSYWFGKIGENAPRWKGGLIKRICEICGTEFSVKHSHAKNGKGRFCGTRCFGKWLSKIQKGKSTAHLRVKQHQKPTKPERIFQEICQKNNIPFHYVGDGQLWIGKKGKKQMNPDFIEANGKKICVEIMGAWWHSPLLNKNLREEAVQSYREKHYKKYKWMPIFIWDTDLLRKDAEQFVLNELRKNRIFYER